MSDPSDPRARRVFLDSASGEPLHPEAAAMLERAGAHGHADPRRLHSEGRRARLLLDNARAAVGEALGVRPDEVTFTGSGTEAVHTGLLGLMPYAERLAVGAADHSAVLQTARWAQARGTTVETRPVDALGRTRWDEVSPGTVTSWQMANHEVGTLQDRPPATTGGSFLDARASGGRLPLPDGGWDVAALSAHQWGGPAGVGVLVVRHGSGWRSPWPDDDRADPRSRGFENLPAALAAGAALQAWAASRDVTNARHRTLVDRLRRDLAALPDLEVHGDGKDRLPHLVSFSCLLVNAEELVQELDRAGYAVASGSACTSSALEPSHVLLAMGALTHGNLRVSLTEETREDDLAGFVEALGAALARLRDAG